MKINRERLRKLAVITVKRHAEDLDYRKEFEDSDVNKTWISEQLDAGNEWAWCCVEVTAAYFGVTGDDFLGCCSYQSKQDFILSSGYYDSMVEDAVAELADNIEKMFNDDHLVEDDCHQSQTCIQCIAEARP